MATTIERLIKLEDSLNRIAELLQESAVIQDRDDYASAYNEEFLALEKRISRMEEVTSALFLKVDIIKQKI